MDITGLVNRVYSAALAIDFGRKGFATRGKAEEGRISYETGINWALSAFKDAQSPINPNGVDLIYFIDASLFTSEVVNQYNSIVLFAGGFNTSHISAV